MAVKITQTDINDIKHYANNARTHSKNQIKKIADSIKNFGFNNPIIIDNTNTIIAGHARHEASKLLNLTHVPTIQLDHLNESQKRAYILADNRITLDSDWDKDFLRVEFNELLADNVELKITGFEDEEIEFLIAKKIDEYEEDDFDFDEKINLVSKNGDLFFLDNHRLLCGDSTNIDDVKRLMNEKKPNLMVTDPPYGVNYDPSWRDDANLGIGKRSRGVVKNDDLIDWTNAYNLFDGDVAYVWHAGKYTNIVAQNLTESGFEIISQIIWSKQHFALSRGDYHWQHEPCWYVVKKGKKHRWNGDRTQSTIWQIKNNNSFGNSKKEETFGHGTQKPLECMLRPILNNSKIGDYIYDPFGGSGTTLIAAEKSNRKCLMMELDQGYCDMIIKRWQKLTGKDAILESNNKKFNELENES